MKMPPKKDPKDYERIKKYDEWIPGEISKVELDEAHQFAGKFPRVAQAVRFKFKLEGHQYEHSSGWMSFSYNEKARLLNKYLFQLVEGCTPNMSFDLDRLQGMKIKTMWIQDGDYDTLDSIRPLVAKIPKNGPAVTATDPDTVEVVGEVPPDDIPY